MSRIFGGNGEHTINQEKIDSIRNKLETGFSDSDLKAALESVEGSGLISATMDSCDEARRPKLAK